MSTAYRLIEPDYAEREYVVPWVWIVAHDITDELMVFPAGKAVIN
jgi:hypothetical protein